MKRRAALQAIGLLGLSSTALSFAKTAGIAALPVIEVYKSATCGCCTQWVDHLKANGFKVKAHNVPNTAAYRAQLGVPASAGSCHTAKIGGYAIEGHVPSSDIKRLLAEQPRARGLAVPDMPMGSPGMDSANADAFDVWLFQADGNRALYRHYPARASKGG